MDRSLWTRGSQRGPDFVFASFTVQDAHVTFPFRDILG